MIGPDFYPWTNLLIIIPRILAPIIHLLSWAIIIFLVYLTKKILILVLNQNQLINYQINFKNSCQFAVKISIMFKSFKTESTIKAQSQEAMLRVIKFDWIANTSKVNKFEIWKPNSLIFSEFCIKLADKPTNSKFQRNERFIMFSNCHY